MMTEVEDPLRRPLNLHFQQLAYLSAVERSGTWAEAARELSVSQPALSQSLSELERRLGVRLFERRGRRRILTDDGREAAAFAREVLARAGRFADRLQQRKRGEAGTLRIGMIDAGSLYLLPEAVRRFRETHPKVDLKLTVAASTTLEDQLRRFEVDVAFVIGDPGRAEGLERTALADEALYLYAPPRRRERPEEGQWLLYPPGSHTRERIEVGLAQRGIHPTPILESGNPQVLRQMVALGFGWAVLPAAVAEAGPHPLRRRRGGAVAVRTLCVARRDGSEPDPRVDSFLAMARKLR